METKLYKMAMLREAMRASSQWLNLFPFDRNALCISRTEIRAGKGTNKKRSRVITMSDGTRITVTVEIS